MKTIIRHTLLAIFILGGTSVFAQEANTLYLKGANFTHPILQAWISEYSKINPNVDIKIADKNTKEANSIELVTNEDNNQTSSSNLIQIARYAIIPVVNKNNPLLTEIAGKSLDKNKVKKLFFEKDIDDDGKYPFKSEATIYSGTHSTSNSSIVSGYFDKTAGQLRGKKIAGDDIYIINAVSKDPNGVAFNYLSYIYDTQTRKLKDNLSILPLDVKKEQLQSLNSGIDETLNLLENQKVNLIPIESVSLSLNASQSPVLHDFVAWVVTEGQKYNHQYGFLNIDSKEQSNIQKQINLASLGQK